MIWRSTLLRFAALIFLMQIAAGAILIGTIGVVLRGTVQDEVSTSIDILRGDLLAIYAEGGGPALAEAVALRTGRMATPGTVLLAVDRDGRKLAGNLLDWPVSVVPGTGLVEAELFRAGSTSPDLMQVEATRLPTGERLLTGRVVESQARVLELFESASIVGLALSLAFAAGTAWIAARWIALRLDGTVSTLTAVQRGDLSQRVPEEKADDAFAALGRAVNRTLDRIETLLRELQIATDGLAHDLKSPLTRLRVALERAVERVREPEAQDAVMLAAREGERLLAMVETALSISRAEAGIGKESFVATDLATELDDIVEIFGPVVEESGRSIRAVASGPLMLPVHRALLGQALGNLIDNSLKYGAGAITLSAAATPDGATISVADQGSGIPPDRHAEALKRFGRLDESRRGTGVGLGLSLVAAVAQLHDGAVTLADAAPGLAVRMHLRSGHTMTSVEVTKAP